jgi:predicted flap endonuclease-1-like 5' DNA nuclease
MDTMETIGIVLVVVLVILILYAFYYLSRRSKNKPITTAIPEIKPQSTVSAAPKPVVPMSPAPVVTPQSTVSEVPKVTEPADLTPMAVAQTTNLETPMKAKPSTEVKTKQDEVQGDNKKSASIKRNRASKIIDIEGIGPTYAEKLNSIGIRTTADLLESGATPLGRRELAEKTGISPKLILEWVNLSDLFRIKGIGEEYSDLLEEAGVDTVVELSHRNATNLHAKILEVNEAKKLVRRPPSQAAIESWIKEAKELPRRIEY